MLASTTGAGGPESLAQALRRPWPVKAPERDYVTAPVAGVTQPIMRRFPLALACLTVSACASPAPGGDAGGESADAAPLVDAALSADAATACAPALADKPCNACDELLPGSTITGNFAPAEISEAMVEVVVSSRLLVFSDSPESPTEQGVLARADLPAGPARLYLYHSNGSTQDMRFAAVLESIDGAPAIVTLERFAIGQAGGDFLGIGRDVTAAFLSASTSAIKSVPAGGRALLSTALADQRASQNQLVHAIIDLDSDAPVRLWVVAVQADADPMLGPDLAPLPLESAHQRGTFVGADRSMQLTSCPEASYRIRLGANQGPLAAPIGVDEISGAEQVLAGHYGVLYRFESELSALSDLLLNPRGGAFAGAVRLDGELVRVPSDRHELAGADESSYLGRRSEGAWSLEWMAPGASSLPIDLRVQPR